MSDAKYKIDDNYKTQVCQYMEGMRGITFDGETIYVSQELKDRLDAGERLQVKVLCFDKDDLFGPPITRLPPWPVPEIKFGIHPFIWR